MGYQFLIIRDRLKYAFNGQEVKSILIQRLLRIDGKVRKDSNYPVGFQDVIDIEKTNEHFRLMIDPKGRFVLHQISKDEAKYKLCRMRKIALGNRGIPIAVSHDAKHIRYPNPNVKANDTVIFDIPSQSPMNSIRFVPGNLAIITHGHSAGRIGIISLQEKHTGSQTIVMIRDALGTALWTRKKNVFVIGTRNLPMISLLESKGVRFMKKDLRFVF